MLLRIDINQDLLPQFIDQLDLRSNRPGHWELSAHLGRGHIAKRVFPGGFSLYQFKYHLKTPIALHSTNPKDSEWLLLNINLSTPPVEKLVNQQKIQLHRQFPASVLLYTPNTSVKSVGPPNLDFEIGLVHFPRQMLTAYFPTDPIPLGDAVWYEDLDPYSEQLLRSALNNEQAALQGHASALEFLARFLQKLSRRQKEGPFSKLHPDDLNNLLRVASQLRNPLLHPFPKVTELAEAAGMSLSKFKVVFKEVFGLPPGQFHQQIKMEYAREALRAGRSTASELSYALGYSHPTKFTLAFKKHFGVLPSAL